MLVVIENFGKDLWSYLVERLFRNDSVDLSEVLGFQYISFEVLYYMESNLYDDLLPFKQEDCEDKLLSFMV